MSVRAMLERQEEETLHPRAARAAATQGRARPDPEDDLRTAYQRDRDRILHCKSFRRLKGKTQVFLAPRGDHYRTRLTHTLEVSQVARTIARALRLNETLVEAMALGHDLGHTPFGHAGERLLDQVLPEGFHHVRQSVRVVEVLEKDGRGLNLTVEVRDGILRHSKGKGSVLGAGKGCGALTLEAEVIRVADIIAYVNHDLDDAIRAGVLAEAEVPAGVRRVLGGRHSERIATFVRDVIRASDLDAGGAISLSGEVHEALLALRDFLYARVYETPVVADEFKKAQRILRELFDWCLEEPSRFRARFGPERPAPAGPDAEAFAAAAPSFGPAGGEPIHRAVADVLSMMTDRYAIETWEDLFKPRAWAIV